MNVCSACYYGGSSLEHCSGRAALCAVPYARTTICDPHFFYRRDPPHYVRPCPAPRRAIHPPPSPPLRRLFPDKSSCGQRLPIPAWSVETTIAASGTAAGPAGTARLGFHPSDQQWRGRQMTAIAECMTTVKVDVLYSDLCNDLGPIVFSLGLRLMRNREARHPTRSLRISLSRAAYYARKFAYLSES